MLPNIAAMDIGAAALPPLIWLAAWLVAWLFAYL
jgi:hypothetical protein